MLRHRPYQAFVLGVFVLQGCGTFMDLDDLKPGAGTDTQTVDTGDTGSGSVDTGTGTDTGSGTETESETQSQSDTPSHSDTDTQTTSDTDSATETETETESVTETVTETQSATETTTETTTETVSESITVDTDTCDDKTCEDFPGECNPLCNEVALDCPCLDTDAPYCLEHVCSECDETHDELCNGYLCGDDHSCETDCLNLDTNCQEGFHCEGALCEADLDAGASCDEPSDCQSGLDCNHDLCCDQGKTCCDDVSDCTDALEPVCDTDLHYCVPCTQNDLCAEQRTSLPVCDNASGECVECVADGDCRGGATMPFNTPLGVCSPEQTCTCWGNSEAGACTVSTECPNNFLCALDWDGPGLADHAYCLRSCDSMTSPVAGLGCAQRTVAEGGTALVWAPMTTCFAFKRFKTSCLVGGTAVCSVDGASGIVDGLCVADVCTYSCWTDPPPTKHDEWCPEGHLCGSVMSPYCQ